LSEYEILAAPRALVKLRTKEDTISENEPDRPAPEPPPDPDSAGDSQVLIHILAAERPHGGDDDDDDRGE